MGGAHHGDWVAFGSDKIDTHAANEINVSGEKGEETE